MQLASQGLLVCKMMQLSRQALLAILMARLSISLLVSVGHSVLILFQWQQHRLQH